MTPWNWVQRWPAYRQAAGKDRLGLGAAAKSAKTQRITPRTKTADKVVKSVCPYCAVGCAQNVYVSKDKVIQIEGDPDSPVSRGRRTFIACARTRAFRTFGKWSPAAPTPN